MTDPLWTVLGEKVEPTWAPEREWAVRAAIARRVGRQRALVRTAVGLASIGLLAVGGEAVLRWRSAAPLSPPVASSTIAGASATGTASRTGPAPSPDREAPAVTVTELSPGTVLAPLPDRNGRGFALQAGGARFSVPHDVDHPFVVTAGDVAIEDLGTTFTVRYLNASELEVAVEEGRVRVTRAGANTEISAGATLRVPVAPSVESSREPERAAEPGIRPEPAEVSSEVARRPPSARPASANAAWRPLAERGQYEEAQRALRKAGPSAVRDDTADLLLAADAARLGGNPAESVPYLERVVRAHARDPRAGLAAFTLGRVLLDELGRPSEAVNAFALARSAGGPLAEDALAREVEALFRAGDVTRSREQALLYRRLYPNGRRAKAVARFGGLD